MNEPTCFVSPSVRVVTLVANGRDAKHNKQDNGRHEAQVQMSPDLPPLDSEAFAEILRARHAHLNQPEE